MVRSELPDIVEIEILKLSRGNRPPYNLCLSMKNTCTFKSTNFDEIYTIKNNYKCNSKMAIYWIECRVCWEQYIGSIKTKFCFVED